MAAIICGASAISGLYFLAQSRKAATEHMLRALTEVVEANEDLLEAYLESEASEQLSIEKLAFIHRHIAEKITIGEFVIAERKGDKIELIVSRNTLKSPYGSLLPFSHIDAKAPVKQALLGKEGKGAGIDYAGDPVLYASRYVAPYAFVAKIDQSELDKSQGPLQRKTFVTLLSVSGLCIALFSYAIHAHFERQRAIQLSAAAEAQELKKADQAKIAYFAQLSHEIRSPVSAITGYLELLSEKRHNPTEVDQYLDGIHRNAKHLLDLVNEIFDISKLRGGRVEIEFIAVNIASLIRDVLAICEERATQKGIDIDVKIVSEVPELVFSDPQKLRQILINLVSNAVKFTDHGNVSIALEYAKKNIEYGQLTFTITDSGPGIEPALREKIFEPFFQEASLKSKEGAGLGLAIARDYARLLRGNLMLKESHLNKGSTFAFSIPVLRVEGARLLTTFPRNYADSQRGQSL